jgi:hypothetical protein
MLCASHAIVTYMLGYVRTCSSMFETVPSEGYRCNLIHYLIEYIMKRDKCMKNIKERKKVGER